MLRCAAVFLIAMAYCCVMLTNCIEMTIVARARHHEKAKIVADGDGATTAWPTSVTDRESGTRDHRVPRTDRSMERRPDSVLEERTSVRQRKIGFAPNESRFASSPGTLSLQ